jgi:hypothetical protein
VLQIDHLIRPLSVLIPAGARYAFDNVSGVSTGYGGELETRILVGDAIDAFVTGSFQRITFDVTTAQTTDVPPTVREVVLPTLKGTAGASWEAVKDIVFGASVIAATARSQRDAIPAGSIVSERARAPGYILFNASVLVDKIFDRAYAKAMVMNVLNGDYRDYVLSLPYNLPRSGTELYVEAGVRMF